MAFKMKGFPTHKGVSPINKLDDPSAGDQSSFIEDADNANPAGDFSFIKNTTNGITTGGFGIAGTGNLIQGKKEATEEVDKKTDGKGLNDGQKKEGEKWYEKQAWKDSGIGHISEAVKSIRRGIKNQKAKRTAKKEKNL